MMVGAVGWKSPDYGTYEIAQGSFLLKQSFFLFNRCLVLAPVRTT